MGEQLKNIHQRLAAVRRECDYIKRDKRVGEGESSYMAVTHDAVTREVRGWFVAHGISVIPYLVNERTVETGQETKNKAKYIRHETVYDVAFVNVDDPKDREVVRVSAHGVDVSDKAPGKTLSYAVKSAILKVLFIETGVNDESRNIDEVSAEDVVRFEEAMDEAQTKDDLRKVLEEAIAEAKQCNDRYAAKRFKAYAEKIVAKKFNEFMPKEAPANDQSGAAGAEPSGTASTGNDVKPAAPAPQQEEQKKEAPKPAPAEQTKPAGDPASPGAIKTIRKAMERNGKTEEQFVAKFGHAVDSTPKASVKAAIDWAGA